MYYSLARSLGFLRSLNFNWVSIFNRKLLKFRSSNLNWVSLGAPILMRLFSYYWEERAWSSRRRGRLSVVNSSTRNSFNFSDFFSVLTSRRGVRNQGTVENGAFHFDNYFFTTEFVCLRIFPMAWSSRSSRSASKSIWILSNDGKLSHAQEWTTFSKPFSKVRNPIEWKIKIKKKHL